MRRLKFIGSGHSFTDINNPFYHCILNPNVEYQIIESTDTHYIFTSGGNSKHRVAKNDTSITVLDNLTPKLVYVLFESGEETEHYSLNIQSIPYLDPTVFPNHEYKLKWKLV